MLQAGSIAPDFALPDAEGNVRRLPDLLRKGRALLVFYKISCPVCQFTLPFLKRIAEQFEILGISQDDARSTLRFTEQFGTSLASAIDPGPNYAASNAYGITSVPSLFVVENDGRISKAFSGFSKADMESLGISFEGEDVPAVKPG